MRVIAGKCRSLQLKTPKGMNTRPTLDRIKETLFNIIRNDVEGSVFLDLFAGSGGIGIEALSRGAFHCYFIDKSKESIECVNANLNHTGLTSDATVLKGDYLSCLYSIRCEHVDIVFIDPPYRENMENDIFCALMKMPYIDSDTLIILEADINNNLEFNGYEIIKVKEYKTNKHLFIRRITDSEQSNLPG